MYRAKTRRHKWQQQQQKRTNKTETQAMQSNTNQKSIRTIIQRQQTPAQTTTTATNTGSGQSTQAKLASFKAKIHFFPLDVLFAWALSQSRCHACLSLAAPVKLPWASPWVTSLFHLRPALCTRCSCHFITRRRLVLKGISVLFLCRTGQTNSKNNLVGIFGKLTFRHSIKLT